MSKLVRLLYVGWRDDLSNPTDAWANAVKVAVDAMENDVAEGTLLYASVFSVRVDSEAPLRMVWAMQANAQSSQSDIEISAILRRSLGLDSEGAWFIVEREGKRFRIKCTETIADFTVPTGRAWADIPVSVWFQFSCQEIGENDPFVECSTWNTRESHEPPESAKWNL